MLWIAKIAFANRQLRGIRATLIKLVLSALSLALAIVGMVSVLAGWYNFGLIMTLITVILLSISLSLSAINTLKTAMPILLRGK